MMALGSFRHLPRTLDETFTSVKTFLLIQDAVFQDQGGIFIGDNCFIGHNCVITTLNHELAPERRHVTVPAPVRLGQGVWVGANVTLLPGVTVGQDAVLAAGAVATKDVPAGAVVAGVPAHVVKTIGKHIYAVVGVMLNNFKGSV